MSASPKYPARTPPPHLATSGVARRRRQRGAALLGATGVLLVVLLGLISQLGRLVLTSQRAAHHVARAQQAGAAAEAGVAWALAMANQPGSVGAACSASGATGSSFEQRYLTSTAPGIPASGVPTTSKPMAGCKLEGLALSCVCLDPASAQTETAASLSGATPPSAAEAAPARFALSFEVESSTRVRLSSRGCAPSTPGCIPGADLGATRSGQAVVNVLLARPAPAPATPAASAQPATLRRWVVLPGSWDTPS